MQQGWTPDDSVAGHRVLRTPLGFAESGAWLDDVGPAGLVTVAGRPALACSGRATRFGSGYAVVDLETGAPIPDRSMLHGTEGPAAAAVGTWGDRAVVALANGDALRGGAYRVRDAWSGEPIGVEFGAGVSGGPIAVATVDGRAILATTTPCALQVWDGAGAGLIAVHDHYVVAFAEHRGRLLAVGRSEAGVLQVWDVLSGAAVGASFPARSDDDGVFDRKYVATVVVDDHLWVVTWNHVHRFGEPLSAWDVTDGRAVRPPVLWEGEPADPEYWLIDLRLSAVDGGIAALARWSCHPWEITELWLPAPSGPQRTTLGSTDGTAIALGVAGDRLTAVVAGRQQALTVYDAAAGAPVASPYYGDPVEFETVTGFADVAGRGHRLVGGSPSAMWDLEAGRPVAGGPRLPDGHRVRAVAAGESGGRTVFAVVSGSEQAGGALLIWDPEDARTVAETFFPAGSHVGPLTFAELAGQPVVACRVGGEVRLIDARTAGPVAVPGLAIPAQAEVTALAAGRLGARPVLAVGLQDGTVRVCDPATGHDVLPPMSGHREAVTAIAFLRTADSDLLVTGGDDFTVRMWDLATGAAVGHPFIGHTGTIKAVLPTRRRDETVIVSVAGHGEPRMWVVDAPARDAGHAGAILAMAAGKRAGRPVFASGSADGTVRLWDPSTGEVVAAIEVGGDEVAGVAFGGPGGDILIAATWGGLVQRFDANTAAALGDPLRRAGERIFAVATADHEGRSLVAAGGEDKTVSIWEVVTGELVARFPVDLDVRTISLTSVDGRLLALVHGAVDDDDYDAASHALLWDVSAQAAVRESLRFVDGGEIASLGVLNGRLVVIQGIDVADEDYSFWGPDAHNLEIRDAVTGAPIAAFTQHGYGRNSQAIMIDVAARPVVVACFERAVAVLDPVVAPTREADDDEVIDIRQIGEEYRGHGDHSSVTCIAALVIDGRLVVASGDFTHGVRINEYPVVGTVS